MSLSAIILAAGKSSRMGRPKALLKWQGKTFLENICVNLIKAGVENIVVVTNSSINKKCMPRANEVTRKAWSCRGRLAKPFQAGQGDSSNPLSSRMSRSKHREGGAQSAGVCNLPTFPLSHFLTYTINPNPEQGMLSSFRCGLRALESTDANVMLCLTDHPMVKIETYKSLIKAARKDKIIIPKFNKRRGHPVIFGADFISELLENDCPEGARTIVRTHPESVEEILVDDSGILLDIDTPEEARKAGINI